MSTKPLKRNGDGQPPKMMTVHFTGTRQHTQTIGGDDEHLSADVLCTIEVVGAKPVDVVVAVKATVGDVGEQPLEIGPHTYKGPIDGAAFRSAVEKYYRSQFGSHGSGVRAIGAANVIMRGNDSGRDRRY